MINIREYEKGDEEGIVGLFNQIYHTTREVDYWKWQFIDNPLGQAVIIVAEKDSQIIGQCTLLPNKMVIKGEEVLVGESIDTMISEDYRGQGLYEKLALKSYEVGRSRGMKIRVGFPTDALNKRLIGESIGARFVGDIPIFINLYKLDNFLVGIVKSKVLAKILAVPSMLMAKFIYKEKKIKIKESYQIEEKQEFNEEFDLLWDKVKKDSQIMKSRTGEFLNWRIKDHPTNDYKSFAAYLNEDLVGYIILKTEKRKVRKKVDLTVGTIIDMVGIDEDVIGALYFKAKDYFKGIKTDFIVSWASPTMKYRQLLIDVGFYRTKGGLPLVLKDLSHDDDLAEYIGLEDNWYLMPIESDLY